MRQREHLLFFNNRVVDNNVRTRCFDKAQEVKLGECVSVTLFWKKRIGRTVYVPGISAFNPECEYGMCWVGIRLEDRGLVATSVLLKTQTLKKRVKFVERDSSPCDLITSDSKEFTEHGEAGISLRERQAAR